MAKISALKAESKALKDFGACQDAELHVMQTELAPFKKQNAMLMNIIQAAEKGHNMLLGTMTDINKEISGTL